MIAEESKLDSSYGNINFNWYPSDLEDIRNRKKITYRLVSPDCDISSNSIDYFRRFNRVAADIACELCKEYTTATLVTHQVDPDELGPYMEEYAEKVLNGPIKGSSAKVLDTPQEGEKFFYRKCFALLRIGKGVDHDMLDAYYCDRNDWIEDPITYNCFAMRDGFFESCPDALFEFNQLSDIEKVRKFLSQFDHVVWQQDMGFDHNDQQITVDRQFISHERVVEIVRQACEKQGARLHVSGK